MPEFLAGLTQDYDDFQTKPMAPSDPQRGWSELRSPIRSHQQVGSWIMAHVALGQSTGTPKSWGVNMGVS